MEVLKLLEEMVRKKKVVSDMAEQTGSIQMDTLVAQEAEATMVAVVQFGTLEEEEVLPSYQVMMVV